MSHIQQYYYYCYSICRYFLHAQFRVVVLSTCPLQSSSGTTLQCYNSTRLQHSSHRITALLVYRCGKEGRILIGPWWSAKAALVRNYLENSKRHWYAIAWLDKLGTDQMAHGDLSKHKFSLSMEMSRLTRDGTAEPVSRDQIIRRKRGLGNNNFPCSADHEQDWQPCPVGTYSCYMYDHTYIL